MSVGSYVCKFEGLMEEAVNSQDNTQERTPPPSPKPSHESFFFCETEIMAFSKGLTFIKGKREAYWVVYK